MLCVAEKVGSLRAFRKTLGLTQDEMSRRVGVSRSGYANWEAGIQDIPLAHLIKLRELGYEAEVGLPGIPAPSVWPEIPYIGYISASTKVDWTDPYASEYLEPVPATELDTRGCFSCRVASDSMMPYLQPEDLLLFRGVSVPRVGKIVLYRHDDGLLTIKQLNHDGKKFVLHAYNPSIEDVEATGTCLGVLIGLYERQRRYSFEDSDGIGQNNFSIFLP